MSEQATHVITTSRDFRTVQHRYPGKRCEHDHAVVALGFTLGLCIPFGDIAGACFEIHLGGQAITQIHLATERVCRVLVPLDKARGYDVTLGVDGLLAL